MTRYFYDVSVGTKIKRDSIGTVCRDDQSAVLHAWSALPGMIVEASPILPWQQFEILVRREDVGHVGRVGMTVVVETKDPQVVAAIALRRA